jgi:signal transduction histidine kinase
MGRHRPGLDDFRKGDLLLETKTGSFTLRLMHCHHPFWHWLRWRPAGRRSGHGFGCKVAVLLVWFFAVNTMQSTPAMDDDNEPAAVLDGDSDLAQWRMIEVPKDATNGLGGWIWCDHTSDKQYCQFWRAVEIPRGATVARALLKMTVDNGYRLFLDGRELGQGTEWRALTEFDLTQLLDPGTHTLAVIAFNDYLQAGMIFGLRIELADGRVIQVASDESWRIVPNGRTGWKTKKQAPADWPAAQIVKSPARSPLWWKSRPGDFVVVPPFKPISISIWHRTWFHVSLVILLGMVLLACIRLFSQLMVQNKEQQLLNMERARIARDIHDDVGTRLTKLVLQGEEAQTTLPANTEAQQQLNRMCEGLRGVLAAMDEVLWAVNPRHDTLENFVAYLCDYAQTFLQNTGTQCLLEVEAELPPLNFDLPLRRTLLLVVKEALNNAAKHSGASRLLLKIHRSGPELVVAVEDNGRGFDLSQARRGNGLANMFQRIHEAGGECKIATQPGAGCQIEFSIALKCGPTRNWFFNRIRRPELKGQLIEGTAPPAEVETASPSGS